MRALPPLVLAVIAACGVGAVLPRIHAQTSSHRSQGPAGAESIREAQLRSDLAFIASDALEGRLAPSPGLDTAAAFLADRLKQLGVRPAGDPGSFLQTIRLTRRRVDVEKTSLSVGGRTLTFDDEFLPGASPGVAEGAVVYIGNGTIIRSRNVDPYEHVDVTGKIVVSHVGLPGGIAAHELGPQGQDWEPTEAAARKRGAVGVLFLPDYDALQRWPTTRETLRTRITLTVDAFQSKEPQLPTATLTARGVSVLFASERIPPADAFQRGVRQEPAAPFAFNPLRLVRLSIVADDEHLTTSNVVGVLDGSDPVLEQEYVALGAHYDHLGKANTPNSAGDVIYNGADDDGSGTVGLLAIAEAFATTRARPRRSLLFVWHTGEEADMWGSRYFTAHPTVPLDRIVAQLNIDMIGRSRPPGTPAPAGSLALTDADSVYVVGSRRLSTQLGAWLDRANQGYHRLRFDYSLDGPHDPADIYRRSDHYQYAVRGIPVAFFFTGVHDDYHGLDDEVDRIDFAKLRRVTQTIYAGARAIADATTRPAVDTAPSGTPSH